jgi:hypothetical protein
MFKKINDYNNKTSIKINKKLNIKKNYNINFDKNKEIITLSLDNNKVLVGKYIFFGIYQNDTKLWIWSSSIPGVNKKQIKIINNIRNKSYLFESDDNADFLFIYQLLTNDVIQIPDIKYITLINKTLNFLSDSLIIFNPTNKNNNIQFIGLNTIIEEYL